MALAPWKEEDEEGPNCGIGLGSSACHGGQSMPEGNDLETPILAGNESYEWAAIPNLDIFFSRLYRYWACKGLRAMALAGMLNLAALAFTVAFSGFLLLGVNWPALLTAECIEKETCDIIDVALYPHVLKSRGLAADMLLLTYLLIFGSYWAWSVVHFLYDMRDMVEVRHFVTNKLGCSDRRMSMMTWAELLHKVVMVQQTTRLCIARDLDEHAVISRIMRKDNYLIALINKGVLRLVPPPLAPTLTVAMRGVAGKTAWAMGAASLVARRAAQMPADAQSEQQGCLGVPDGSDQAAPATTDAHMEEGCVDSSVAKDLREQRGGTRTGPGLHGGVGRGSRGGLMNSEQLSDAVLEGLPGVGEGGRVQGQGHVAAGHAVHAAHAVSAGENGSWPQALEAHDTTTRMTHDTHDTQPLIARQGFDGCRAGSGSSGGMGGNFSGSGGGWAHWVRGVRRLGLGGALAAVASVVVVAAVWAVRHALWLLAVVLEWGSWGLQKLSGSRGSTGSSWRLGSGGGSGTGRFGLSSNGLALLGGRRPLLTKTLEWNLRWCLLDHMFDEQFCVRRSFLEQPEVLKKRFRTAALINAVLSPFLLLFLLLYFFMRNAEHFYHHPGAAGSRRWSALARWRLRELNELPHYCSHRLDAAHASACNYCAQFPSYTLASAARFVSFVVGSFTALLLLVTLLDEKLLERPLFGRHVVWWLATLGVVLTASRSFMNEDPVAHDPERAMQQVVAHTHHLPRHWRGRAHTLEVQQAFNQLFQYKVLLFLEELASVILTPFMLFYTLPQCADDIVAFVNRFTTHVEGVGDICSLAAFNLQDHGNHKYGAPTTHVPKADKSRQGKMEKSFLTFVATYPTWEPGPAGKAMLLSLTQKQQQQQQLLQQHASPFLPSLGRPATSPSVLHPSHTLTTFPSPPSYLHTPSVHQHHHQHQHQHQLQQQKLSAPQMPLPHGHGPLQQHQLAHVQQPQQQQQQQQAPGASHAAPSLDAPRTPHSPSAPAPTTAHEQLPLPSERVSEGGDPEFPLCLDPDDEGFVLPQDADTQSTASSTHAPEGGAGSQHRELGPQLRQTDSCRTDSWHHTFDQHHEGHPQHHHPSLQHVSDQQHQPWLSHQHTAHALLPAAQPPTEPSQALHPPTPPPAQPHTAHHHHRHTHEPQHPHSLAPHAPQGHAHELLRDKALHNNEGHTYLHGREGLHSGDNELHGLSWGGTLPLDACGFDTNTPSQHVGNATSSALHTRPPPHTPHEERHEQQLPQHQHHHQQHQYQQQQQDQQQLPHTAPHAAHTSRAPALQSHALPLDAADDFAAHEDEEEYSEWEPQATIVHSSLFGAPPPLHASSLLPLPPPLSNAPAFQPHLQQSTPYLSPPPLDSAPLAASTATAHMPSSAASLCLPPPPLPSAPGLPPPHLHQPSVLQESYHQQPSYVQQPSYAQQPPYVQQQPQLQQPQEGRQYGSPGELLHASEQWDGCADSGSFGLPFAPPGPLGSPSLASSAAHPPQPTGGASLQGTAAPHPTAHSHRPTAAQCRSRSHTASSSGTHSTAPHQKCTHPETAPLQAPTSHHHPLPAPLSPSYPPPPSLPTQAPSHAITIPGTQEASDSALWWGSPPQGGLACAGSSLAGSTHAAHARARSMRARPGSGSVQSVHGVHGSGLLRRGGGGSLRGSVRSVRATPPGCDSLTSSLLPANEDEDLVRRLVAGHGTLQSLYEQMDHTVVHRYMAQPNRQRPFGAAGSGLLQAGRQSEILRDPHERAGVIPWL